jgi:signal transduction histidine kinase
VSTSVLEWVYLLVFGAAAAACLASVVRAMQLESPDIRNGLVGLLVLSGLWGAATVGRLASSDPQVTDVFYIGGLVVGLGTVGAWLYFCSAYAGKGYHRDPLLRRAGLGAYLAIVGVKLTNPVHGLYFTTRTVAEPFPHLVVEFGAIHWVVTAIAYALSAVGFYILYDVFRGSNYSTFTLGVLVCLTALPVGFDLVGILTPGVILELNYEPLGVAAFAVGTLFFVEEKFVAVPAFGRQEVIEATDEPVLLLDRDDVLRDHNPAAASAFPAVVGRTGERLDGLVPALLGGGDGRVGVDGPGGERYYIRTETELSLGPTRVGRALVFTDVTRLERQRRELERQNEQLEDFEDAITHELRNTLGIVRGHLDLASEALEPGSAAAVSLGTIEETTDRMTRIVNDLVMLARQGRTIGSTEPCELGRVAESARSPDDGIELRVLADGYVLADRDRLRALLTETYEFAALTDSERVTVEWTEAGFTLTTDGDPIEPGNTETAFEYGSAVPTAEAGMSLPNVAMLARVHGWDVAVDPGFTDGVRIRVEGVDGGEEDDGDSPDPDTPGPGGHDDDEKAVTETGGPDPAVSDTGHAP